MCPCSKCLLTNTDKPLNSLSGQFGNPLNKYIRHYEGLSYDTEALHNSHQRAKRALSAQDRTVHLDFHAHGRSVSGQMHTLSSSLIHSLFLSSEVTAHYAALISYEYVAHPVHHSCEHIMLLLR